MHRTGAALALSTALVLGGCGDDTDGADGATDRSATTAVVDTTTPHATTAPRNGATTVAPEGNDPMDYEGQRWDFGAITGVADPDGVVMIEFNRQQLYTDDGLQSAEQFSTEPIVYGNTDVPYVDDSQRVRTFVLADDAEILRIADPIPCASDEYPAEPAWTSISVAELVGGAWKDRLLDTLTFDQNGLVSRVRLSSGC